MTWVIGWEYTSCIFADATLWGAVAISKGSTVTWRDLIRLEKRNGRNRTKFGKSECKVLHME